MLVDSQLDDVMLTSAMTGLPTNLLRPSVRAVGLDPGALPADLAVTSGSALYGGGADAPKRWRDIFSAGHSVSGVTGVESAAEIVGRIRSEYETARDAMLGS